MEIEFLRPWLLTAMALVLPIVGALWYFNFYMRLKARRNYGEPRLVDKYSRPMRLRSELLVLFSWLASIAFIMIAAAGPIRPAAPANVPAGTLQVIVVWDVSKSMLSEEYRPYLSDENSPPEGMGPFGNRVDMVRHVVMKQLMPALVGNELGIVTYSGNGFVQAELMDEFESMKWVLVNWVKPGAAPGGGSDYAEGLLTAITMFKEAVPANGKERVIVLFSDGGFTGTPEGLAEAVKLLQENGIRLVIVGVGSKDPVVLPEYNANGQLIGYLKNKEGQTATAALEEQNLINLSGQTGGEYIHLEPSTKLDIKWASTLAGSKMEKHGVNVYHYPLGAGLALLLLVFGRGLFRRNHI